MSSKSLDFEVLSQLKELMSDEFNVLVSVFVSDGKTQIENLKLAMDSSNSEEIRRIAHTLKGSSLNFGAHKLSELCKFLEHKAAANELDDTNSIIQKIVAEFEEVKETLENSV